MKLKSLFILAVLPLSGYGAYALAQIGVPSEEEAQRSVYDIAGGAGFRSRGLSDELGLEDPRDFTGTWNREGDVAGPTGAAGGMGASAAFGMGAGAAGGMGAGAPAGGPPLGAALGGTPASGSMGSAKMECIPSAGAYNGGDGPVEFIQTENQLTWMAEAMHAIRRIYINADFTPGLKPSINGESIGHFEGDTLVVETRGMDSLPEGGRMIERISKSEQGRLLTDEVSYLDAEGKTSGQGRTITLFYRPNEKLLEWICEDYGEAYYPGTYQGFSN